MCDILICVFERLFLFYSRKITSLDRLHNLKSSVFFLLKNALFLMQWNVFKEKYLFTYLPWIILILLFSFFLCSRFNFYLRQRRETHLNNIHDTFGWQKKLLLKHKNRVYKNFIICISIHYIFFLFMFSFDK